MIVETMTQRIAQSARLTRRAWPTVSRCRDLRLFESALLQLEGLQQQLAVDLDTRAHVDALACTCRSWTPIATRVQQPSDADRWEQTYSPAEVEHLRSWGAGVERFAPLLFVTIYASEHELRSIIVSDTVPLALYFRARQDDELDWRNPRKPFVAVSCDWLHAHGALVWKWERRT